MSGIAANPHGSQDAHAMTNDPVSARPSLRSEYLRRVAIVAVPDFELLDVAGPLSLFGSATHDGTVDGTPAYQCHVIGLSAGLVTASIGAALNADAEIGDAEPESYDTILVAGGVGARDVRPDPSLLAWLRRAAGSVRRVGSVCTGAFVLAEAGVLDGRRATTHWRHADHLAARYPEIRVEPDRIYVHDSGIWTSAGVTSGMDMALAMIADDLGRRAALELAKSKVMYMHRPGGQSQFSAELALQTADEPRLAKLQGWVFDNLSSSLTVEELAERAAMSPRNFNRVFTRSIGVSPARFVERARVDAARRRLEGSGSSIETVAHDTGFGNAERMRRSFLRQIGIAPSDYRQRFGPRTTEIAS
jgi:transcriptional regulator GlxA family with amidase domain